MIIERLTLNNFLTIYGIQTIVFPKNKSHSITVIIAPNNSGKTTIVRALKFLFYGYVSAKQRQNAVSLEAIRVSGSGETIESSVEAKISNAGKAYTICRSLKAVKKSKESFEVDVYDTRLTMIEHLPAEDFPYEDEIVIQNIIKQMVPEGLFDFFFFKGEELADRLVDPRRRDTNLYDGLSEVLYKDKWDNTLETLKAVQGEFGKKFHHSSKHLRQVITILEEKKHYTEENDSLRSAVANTKTEVVKLKRDYDELDKKVLDSIPAKNTTVKEKLKQLQRLRQKCESRVDELTQTLRISIGGSGGIFFLGDAFAEAFDVLSKLQDDKLLPPDISESILSSILNDKICICGTPLEDGSHERAKIEKLRQRALAESLSTSLYTLFCNLKKESHVGYPAIRTKTILTIDENSKKLDKATEDLASYEKEYSIVENEYDQHADVTYKRLKNQRDEALSCYQQTHDRLLGIERKLKENEYELNKLEKRLKEIKVMPAEAKKYQQCEQLTNRLVELVQAAYEELQNFFWEFLQSNVSDLYEKIVTDGSKATIDKITLLPSIERAGRKGLSQGGGQQQTLVLSYIMALSKLRKDVNKQIREHFNVRMVDDQCFFMDSVFAPMQAEYRLRVAKAMPGKMSQLVLLVAPQQWDAAVSNGLKGHIDSAYQFVIKTNKIVDNGDYSIEFFGSTLQLVETVQERIHAYTKICKLEV